MPAPREQQGEKAAQAPCAALSKESLKCLDKNNYDRAACQEAFDAYKACKKQEVETRLQRRLESEKKKGGLGLF